MGNNPKEKSPMYSDIVIGAHELAVNLEMAHLRSVAIHYFMGKDPSEVESIYKKYFGLLLELSKETKNAIQYEINRNKINNNFLEPSCPPTHLNHSVSKLLNRFASFRLKSAKQYIPDTMFLMVH